MHRWIVAIWMAGGMLAAQPGSGDIPARNLGATLDAMPLYTARQQLWLARSRILDGRKEEAVAPFAVAAQALSAFRDQERGPNGQAADYLRQEIQNYTRVMANGDSSGALSRIEDWASRIDSLCNYCTYPPAGLVPRTPKPGPPT